MVLILQLRQFYFITILNKYAVNSRSTIEGGQENLNSLARSDFFQILILLLQNIQPIEQGSQIHTNRSSPSTE